MHIAIARFYLEKENGSETRVSVHLRLETCSSLT